MNNKQTKEIVITSGNCIEKIDSIRTIANSSSGKLGALITETLVENQIKNSNESINIYYICSRKSTIPDFGHKNNDLYWKQDNNIIKVGKIRIGRNDMGDYSDDELERAFVHIIYTDSASEIYDVMKSLLTDNSKNITHVIHARAISDYEVDYVSSTRKIDEYLNSLCDNMPILSMYDITNMLIDGNHIKLDNSTKLSSNEDDLIIRLKKNKKIISYIKQWNPKVKLIGFKLLDTASQEELIYAAKAQIEKSDSDWVVMNDISQITNSQHIAYILDKQDNIITCNTKQEIATVIAEIVMNNE